jgi:hypothetical protein
LHNITKTKIVRVTSKKGINANISRIQVNYKGIENLTNLIPKIQELILLETASKEEVKNLSKRTKMEGTKWFSMT